MRTRWLGRSPTGGRAPSRRKPAKAGVYRPQLSRAGERAGNGVVRVGSDRSSTCPYFALVAEIGKRRLAPHTLGGCGYRACPGLAQRDRSRGGRIGDVARDRSASSDWFRRRAPQRAPCRWKVLWIVEPVVLHGMAAEAVSIGTVQRGSRSGGLPARARDGASEVPRSRRQAAENAACRYEAAGRSGPSSVVKHGVHRVGFPPEPVAARMYGCSSLTCGLHSVCVTYLGQGLRRKVRESCPSPKRPRHFDECRGYRRRTGAADSCFRA
jgi:hypothetical protein